MGYKVYESIERHRGGLASGANSATIERERGKFVMVHFHFYEA